MKKVFVGMSGGVDSSVSAALLQKEGYDVTGVFIKAWHPDFLPCSWREERLDAMRVCAALGIPFMTMDLEKEYKKSVVDYMIAEYAAGRTPNPDVMCNKTIKFGVFFDRAMKLGADFVATGHYARIIKKHTYELHEAVDAEKEQSYFLWTLTQKQLSKTIFPVGGMQKSRVRALAKSFGLPVAQKKDSQGLCFLGHVDMAEFLKHYLPAKKGKVLDTSGAIIGTHQGAAFYTIGQRHGFTITTKGTDDKALYVSARDVKKNTITVAPRSPVSKSPASKSKKDKQGIVLSTLSWTDGVQPDSSKPYLARIRYHQNAQQCRIALSAQGIFTVRFAQQQEAVSAGQSLVLYDGTHCLGGGIIEQ